MINAETSDSFSGGNLWQKIRDRWRARRAERETKTHQTAGWRVEGRRDDGGHELGVGRERQGQTHRHEAAQRRPQDSVRPTTTSSGSQRRSLHVLDDQARGARVLRAYSEQATAKGKGHGPGPPGIAAFTGLLQALSERGSAVGTSNAAGGARHQRCRASRTHSWALGQTVANRLLGQAPSGALERALLFSDRAELKKREFRGRISTHITRQTPCTNCGLEKIFCVGQRINGRSRAGPWTWSSLRRKTQHVKCILRATSHRWQACVHGIRSRRRGHRLALDSVSLCC